ncbi:hypothetical protein OIDMADRAFT_116781 [Oidiodendron maius Zn]|uniref:RING-type domain-containing protein n=1 Tax=Oidiodendron maius (strain Zn) TaxID=913774 RepID=A0A0C3HL78_OIDMZ|nr:hypothetical protein OIDMADRAFT_116781 [Oidiodendron maius Zn]
METYFPDPNVTRSEIWTPQDFYQSVYTPNRDDKIAATIDINIKSTLFPFQKRAVRWLLRREGVDWAGRGIRPRDAADIRGGLLPLAFIESEDARGQSCFVSSLYGCATLDPQSFQATTPDLKGGILAEEMGLGKTVEMISLITAHRRCQQDSTILDPYTFTVVKPIGTTLIICPPTLVQQWMSEIHKHSHLKVMHYEGITKAHKIMTEDELRDNLINSDVVISTYGVLAAEIYYTPLNPERSLRREAKYKRPKSPLMEFSWWRICIDEAQMVESGVSNAATVARILPRINAWCITGTPVRRDVNDLLGLLVFLRAEPYASKKHVWASLISTHKSEFRRLFGHLALRHNKKTVRNELRLPAQKRYVITMPFTPIEEQHYQELFSQMCKDCGLNLHGAPLNDDWDPELVAERMRYWLVRLRQTCVHPAVGGRNRRALGSNDGPLRTVDQVLEVMIDQTDVSIRTDQRLLLSSKLRRGQLLENGPRVGEALEIWDSAAREVAVIVEECRDALRKEIAKIPAEDKAEAKGTDISYDDSDSPEKPEEVARLSVFRNRLRGALEIEHVAVFFRSNAYFQIKSNEELTDPESQKFQELEKLELTGYEDAKKLRREILQEIFGKVGKLMKKVSKKASMQSFAEIPEFKTDLSNAGLMSRRIIDQLESLASALDAQANTLDGWREHTIQLLLRPLVDEDEGIEVTGEEYEESTKHQDEIFCYVQALRTVIADRHETLTGQENKLIHYESKTALRLAKEGGGAFPEKTVKLLQTREGLKTSKQMGSVRGVVGELRALATSLRPDAENANSRGHAELTIVKMQLKKTQEQLSDHTKATAALEKEIELFTHVMNTRLEYYRQLQQVSDSVAPYEGPINDRVLGSMEKSEETLAQKIASARAKRRYLEHLRTEASNPVEQRICVICRETFEVGAITVCGHQYCKECIAEWWHSHRSCPVCKMKLHLADLHEITYKPQELSIEAEEVHDALQERASPSAASLRSAIYAEISKAKLAEIKNIELDGPSFTTKIDTLARHLIWLRESDPGAKSIIYSQFKDFLEVLARAFKKFRIGFTSIERPNGIENFTTDPAIECFLLHARAHSSGLNLINASHVFLCEPLLNTALELQAIARVDRIGQEQETNVWLYLIGGTVEESIHQLSVKRRMEHIGQAKAKGKAKETTPEEILDSNLEEANSLELQQAPLTRLLAKGQTGGEMIEQDDLWECLFGSQLNGRSEQRGPGEGQVIGSHELRNNEEVRRYLAAGAATMRVAQQT